MNNDFNNNLNENMDNQNMNSINNTNETISQPVNNVNNLNEMPNQSMNIGPNNPAETNTLNVGVDNNFNNMNNNINLNNPNVANIPQENIPKKEKSIIPVLIAILVLALVGIGVFFGYKYVFVSNPVKVIEKTFDTLAAKTELAIEEYNKEMNKFLNSKISNELYVELNQYNAKLVTKLDVKNKIMGASIDAVADNTDFLNLSGILDEKGIYFKILKNSSNNYALYEDFSELFDTEDIEEMDSVLVNIVKYLKESFKETISEKDFVKTKESISINGKNVNATKYSLVLDEKTINPWLNNYKEKIKNDDALITYITDLYNKSQELSESGEKYNEADIKDMIDELFEELEFDPDYNDPVNYALFVKGTDIIKMSLYDEENSIDLFLNEGINVTYKYEEEEEFSFTYKEDYLKLYIYDENNDTISFEYNKENYELSINDGELVVSGKLKELENGLEMTFNTEIEGENFEGLVRLKTTYPEDLDLKVPDSVLDIENEYYLSLFAEEFKQTPVYIIIDSIMNANSNYIPVENYDNNLIDNDIDIQF